MSMLCIPPYTPLLYSKTRVCRGIPTFLIFDPKHRLWVLVRTVLPTMLKLSFLQLKKSLYISLACFHNEDHYFNVVPEYITLVILYFC